MSDLSADELEKLAGAATARPWSVEPGSLGILISDGEDAIGEMYDEDDADFIVYLANHADDLAAANEKLEAIEAATRKEVAWSSSSPSKCCCCGCQIADGCDICGECMCEDDCEL